MNACDMIAGTVLGKCPNCNLMGVLFKRRPSERKKQTMLARVADILDPNADRLCATCIQFKRPSESPNLKTLAS